MTGIDIGGLHAGVGGDGAGVSVDGHGVGVGWNGNNDNVEGNGGSGVSVNGHGAGIGVNGLGDDVNGNAGIGWNAGDHHGAYVGQSGDGQAHVDAGDEWNDSVQGQGQVDAQQPPAPAPAANGASDQASSQGQVDVNGGQAGGAAAGAGLGAGFGGGIGAGGGIQAGANIPLAPLPNPGVGASCTVLGGPARLLYLPPGDAGRNEADATTPSDAGTTPTPAGGDVAPKDQPITAWANTFNPDYCYLSFSTLYATQSGTTIGPTFSNALIPFKTTEISTVCASQPTGAATPFSLAGLSTGGGDNGCYHVVAPPRIGKFIPSWDNAMYWNVSFQQPQVILPEGGAKNPPENCLVCAAPAFSLPAGTAYPTMVNEGYPKNYQSATETAPPGSSAASFGQFTATRPDLASPTITGSPTSPFGSIGSNVSTSSVSQYTGAATLTTASGGRLGLLAALVPLLLAVM